MAVFNYAIILTLAVMWSVGGDCAVCPPDPPHPRAITRLHQNLFCDYDRLARPVASTNATVPLFFLFQVNSIEMTEHDEALTVQGPVTFVWPDMNLKWKPADYDGILYTKVDDNEIWVPDLTLNALTQVGESDLKPSGCILWYSGTIHCLPQMSISAPCKQNVRYWPFDEHECSFTLSSFLYFESHVNLSKSILNLNSYQKSREWELKSWNITRLIKNLTDVWTKPTIYPFLMFNFVLRRHAASFFAATVLPGVSILFLMLTTFWMGEMTMARICVNGLNIMGAILFLDYSLYIVSSNGDDVPVIITLFRDGLSMSVFGIIVAVVHRLMTTCSTQPPLFITAVTDWLDSSIIGRILLLSASPIRDDEATIIEAGAGATKPSPWAPLAILLDRLGFLIALLVTTVLILRYIP